MAHVNLLHGFSDATWFHRLLMHGNIVYSKDILPGDRRQGRKWGPSGTWLLCGRPLHILIILRSSYNMGESFFLGFNGSTGLEGLGKGMLPWVLLLGEDRRFSMSNGRGKTTVEGFSVDKDWRVWRYRSCTAAGVPDRISAAILRDSEAAFSPSAAII